jgi:hypothetical protein
MGNHCTYALQIVHECMLLYVRTVFPTVDAHSSGPSRSAIHHRVHSNLLQKSEKRQRARRCFYRGHSDAKVKI